MIAEPEYKPSLDAPLTIQELRVMEMRYEHDLNISIVVQQAIKRRMQEVK